MSVFLSFAFLAALLAHIGCTTQRRGPEASGRRFNRIQHGQCTYTFILPEQDGNCRESTTDQYNTNALQRDAPHVEQDFSFQKLQHLEHVMENYTQWLQKLESYIVENMKSEMVQLQQNAVQNHTATMLEIGTSLLSQTAEQTRKLTDVETQVLNQTSRLEIQLLENSLSTYKLEKQLLQQTNEILKIHEKNRQESFQGCTQVGSATGRREADEDKGAVRMRSLLLQELEEAKGTALSACSISISCHASMYNCALTSSKVITRMTSINFCAHCTENVILNASGVCVSVCLQLCKKSGFGSPSGEHWLGNEFIFAITSQRQYSLRIELMDWEGNRAYSQYDRFHIGNEKQNYRLYLKGHSGTAGKQSSLILHGAEFSTKDADNDNCMCKCALMLTGGGYNSKNIFTYILLQHGVNYQRVRKSQIEQTTAV
uniref:Angiopoietin 1 n=1 Tax=Pavo cristatus TaxID=9049 RepID=A0A8C9FY74_PAVCR